MAYQLNAPAAKSITPTLTNKPELCLTCHDGIEEISPSHPIQTFGCVICHGGNALALDKTLAHTGLRGGKNPSDFAWSKRRAADRSATRARWPITTITFSAR